MQYSNNKQLQVITRIHLIQINPKHSIITEYPKPARIGPTNS